MIAVGAQVGGYLLSGELGRGGMGVVYTARHALLGRPAAVKVLRPELSRDPVVVGRFFNEARAASAIRHRGIVEIYDFGLDASGAAYIVMELLDGESLAARLARGRRPLAQWWPIVRSIASALAAAHAQAIVHRDLKPDNVFLIGDDEVHHGERIKLLDFGVAKLAPERGAIATQTGALIGTPVYMAPEQCRGVAVDHRADLYALGCIAFEMATGRPPFSGEGFGDVLAAHIHEAPADLVALGVAPAAAALVARLLAKDPRARFDDAAAVVRAVDALPVGGDEPSAVASPYAPTRAMTMPSAVPTRVLETPAPARTITTLGASAGVEASARGRRRAGVAAAVTALLLASAVVVTITVQRADRAAVESSAMSGSRTIETAPDAGVLSPDASLAVDAAPPTVDAAPPTDAPARADVASPVDAGAPDARPRSLRGSPAPRPLPVTPAPPRVSPGPDHVTNPYRGRR